MSIEYSPDIMVNLYSQNIPGPNREVKKVDSSVDRDRDRVLRSYRKLPPKEPGDGWVVLGATVGFIVGGIAGWIIGVYADFLSVAAGIFFGIFFGCLIGTLIGGQIKKYFNNKPLSH